MTPPPSSGSTRSTVSSGSRSATPNGRRSPRNGSTSSPMRPTTISGSTSTPSAAKEGPFGGAIAHGYLTLSLGPVLLQKILGHRPA